MPTEPASTTTALEAVEAAKVAGLRYVSDHKPGIRRLKAGNGFRYQSPDGKAVRDKNILKRIKSLAIPPAWREVWICTDPNGHLQATGRDDRDRKQYRYHPRWREVRDEDKYSRMIAFGKALSKIRRHIRRDLRKKGMQRERVLAAVVNLLELTAIRIGNEEYAQQNKSYGLTTLRDRHAKVNGSRVHFHFQGKSGKAHEIDIDHPRIARTVKKCQDLPGQDLFQYVNGDGAIHDVTSGDVNDYLMEITGKDFTAKDFRTWIGTLLAATALREFKKIDSKAAAKRNILQAIETVAKRLGNTPAICKKCYIHPAVFDSYMDGSLDSVFAEQSNRELARSLNSLHPEEAAVITLLQRKLKEAEPGGLKKKLSKSLRQARKHSNRRN